MQRNDCVISALGPGQYNDLLLQYYLDNGAVSDQIDDAEYEFLEAQGITGSSTPDMWYNFLTGQGYSGTLTDMQYAFWCISGGGIFSFLVIPPDLIDTVSGNSPSIVFDATAVSYDGNTAGANEALFENSGAVLFGGVVDQLVPYSEDTSNWTGAGPWTEIVNVTETTVHTLSTDLNGATVSIAAGTATIDGPASATFGNPDQFTVTGAGTLTITTDVADPKAQVTADTYKLPYLYNPTAGTISSALRYTNGTQGVYYDIEGDLLDSFAGIGAADAQGEMVTEWTPKHSYDEPVDGVNLNILTIHEESFGLLYAISGPPTQLRMYDGTTICTLTGFGSDWEWQANTKYQITQKWGPHPDFAGASKMVISVTDGTTTWDSSVVDFDGSFNPGDFLSPAYDTEYFQEIDLISIKKEVTW